MKLKKFLTAVAVLAVCSGAQAATVSFSYGLPVATSSTVEINQNGNLGLFDSNLGTLTGASLTIEGAALMSFSANNTTSSAGTANVIANARLIWDSSINDIDSFIGETMSFVVSTGYYVYFPHETINFGPSSQASSQTDNLGSILGSLQAAGGGNFTLNCQSLSGFTILGQLSGSISTTNATQAGCGATITYTYDVATTTAQVAEPASLALVGFALAGAGFVTRRRKASQS